MTEIQPTCPRCHSQLFTEEDEYRIRDIICVSCGYRKDITKHKPIIIPEEEIHIPSTRLIHGISSKTSTKIWRRSPAGKASIRRYNQSELFLEAHERHRKTEKYRISQERFKERRKLFKLLVSKPLISTCPLGLFYKSDDGETFNDQSKCNLDGNGNCIFGCI